LIEQPRRAGAALTSPDPKTVELTPQAYRIPANLPADGNGSLTVVEEQPIEETVRLLDIDDNRLGVLISSAELDPKMKQALTELAARRQAIARQRGDLNRLQAQRDRLIEDENRLRANLAAVGSEPELRRQQLEKFAGSESAIDKVSAAVAGASEALAAAERDLAAYISSLTL
jgi:chromosome segregation ATPase